MFEFISENPDTLALSIAVIAGLFGFVKWLEARTLKLKNERYVKYIQLIRVLSGYNDNKEASTCITEQVASAWLLLEYKEHYSITLNIFDNPDLEQISNIKWQQFVLPQVKRVILEMKSKQPPTPQKPK